MPWVYGMRPDYRVEWSPGQGTAPPRRWTCGFCGCETTSAQAWRARGPITDRSALTTMVDDWALIYVCACGLPTVFQHIEQYPPAPAGVDVEHLPADVRAAYREARA